MSQESSSDVVEEAFSLGASADLIKSKAENDLMVAVHQIAMDKQFASDGSAFYDVTGPLLPVSPDGLP